MAHYTGTVPTVWSPEELFAYMADVRNFTEWDPGTRRVTQVAGNPLLARSFRKNGDRAARGLRSVLAQRAPGAV